MLKILVLCLPLALAGCGLVTPATRSETKLTQLSIGSDRQSVVNLMGTPDTTKAEKLLDGRTQQVDEYRLFKPGTSATNFILGIPFLTVTWWTPWLGDKFFDSYSIRYTDNKVDHWGRTDEGQQKFVDEITLKER